MGRDDRRDAGGFDAEAAKAQPLERGGGIQAGANRDRAGWGERRGEAGQFRGHHEDGDQAARLVGSHRGTGVVRAGNVEDDGFVGRVVVVAVGAPAAGEEVEFDRAAEIVAARIEDGAGEIGAGAAAGDAGEDDLEAAAILEAKRAGDSRRPARRQGGLGPGRNRLARGIHSSAPGEAS